MTRWHRLAAPVLLLTFLGCAGPRQFEQQPRDSSSANLVRNGRAHSNATEKPTLHSSRPSSAMGSSSTDGSLVSSTALEQSSGIYPEYRCMDLGCPASVVCGKSVCEVVHCGTGPCRFCPEPAPDALKNIVFKAWCSYGCMRGPVATGSTFGFITTLGNVFVGPFCAGIESHSLSNVSP